jgi:Tfp pilus assembly protein PilO
MKMQPREQAVVGIGSILMVIVLGWNFIDPALKSFNDIKTKFDTSNNTFNSNEATINALTQDKTRLSGSQTQIPVNKEIGEIDLSQGQTLESTKIELLNDILKIAQDKDGNTLVSIKPLPPPAPPAPVAAPAPPDPNNPTAVTEAAPPEMNIADFIAEVPYDITVRGTYATIGSLIDDLSAYKIVVEVQRLEITPGGTGGVPLKDPTKPLTAVLKINYLIKKS